MIILLYGQPASGKTTLANILFHNFCKDSLWVDNPIKIDGDRWRDITQNKDYSREGRIRNLKGAFDMALYLEREGCTPIVSLVTPYEELRDYLSSNALKLAMIYLCYEEDRGRNDKFVSDFEEPKGNYLKINTSKISLEDSVNNIHNYIKDIIQWGRTKDGIKKSM
jgi:adenylylsulfate kinase